MPKISKIDSAALKSLRAPIEAELAAIGERLGIKFEVGSGTYEAAGAEASFKLKMTVDDPATRADAARKRWDANCRFIGVDYSRPDDTGLRPEDFGTEFEYRGIRYRASGVNPGRSKFCISAEALTGAKAGTTFGFDERAVPMIRSATDAAKTSVAA